MTIVNNYICDGISTDDPPNVITLETVLQQIVLLGEKMSTLSDKVDQVLALEADEDAQAAAALEAKDAIIADLQAQLADVSGQLTVSLGNDRMMQDQIDAKTAELDAQAADIQAQIDRLNEAFPTPVTEPPVDSGDGGAVVEPPVDSGNGGEVTPENPPQP